MFPDKDATAHTYDVAALYFHGREAVTNHLVEGTSGGELAFLTVHSKSEIVDMLRKHTYTNEF